MPLRQGYTHETTDTRPSWSPVPMTCGHVHRAPHTAARCHRSPFGRPMAVVAAVLVEGRVVTAAGRSAPPEPPAPPHCVQPVHPADLELTDADLAWLASDKARAAA